MFRITEDLPSGSLVQCLAKTTEMVLSCPLIWTWSVLWPHIVTRCASVYSSLSRNVPFWTVGQENIYIWT